MSDLNLGGMVPRRAQSRLNTYSQATSDAGGNATFTFDGPSSGWVNQGAIFVQGAPTTAQFSATAGPVPWGSWAGAQPYGVQAWPGDTVTVTAMGLAPNTTYQAGWVGAQVPEALANYLAPTAAGLPSGQGTLVVGAASMLAVQNPVTIIGGVGPPGWHMTALTAFAGIAGSVVYNKNAADPGALGLLIGVKGVQTGRVVSIYGAQLEGATGLNLPFPIDFSPSVPLNLAAILAEVGTGVDTTFEMQATLTTTAGAVLGAALAGTLNIVCFGYFLSASQN